MNKACWTAVIAVAVLVGTAGKALAEDKAADAKPADAKPAAEAPKPPETILFDKTAKMAPVNFPHAEHIKKFDCKVCHAGDTPLFPQKKEKDQPGMKMADFYAGKQCGSCHDGKKTVDGKPDGKAIFAAKTGCMKCHKKPDAAAK
jgi:c(7)-type cytochrome triheme protein